MVALFDIHVVDTDTPSYSHRDVAAITSSAEEDNKRKYCDAAEVRHASFTPLVVSVDGVLGWEAECFIKLLAEKIAIKWKKSYPEVAGWIRARLSFAILMATKLSLRGSRIKWRSGTAIDDGAGLPELAYLSGSDVYYYYYYYYFYFFYFLYVIILCIVKNNK